MAASYQSLLWRNPSPSPLPSGGISEFLYYPISKFDFDYTQYHAITQAFSQAVRMVWKSSTSIQLCIFAIMVLSLIYTTHNGRRYGRKGSLRRFRRRTSFKVEELYENNVLVAVVDVPKHKRNTAGGRGSKSKEVSPVSYGLVRRERVVHAEEVGSRVAHGRKWRAMKTRLLLLARPPVGLLG